MKMRRVRFFEEADSEFVDAMEWYEEQRTGLGDEFFDAVDAAVVAAQMRPYSFQTIYHDVRRVLLKRFPHSVLFIVEQDEITVIAVFHAKRDPKHCQNRV